MTKDCFGFVLFFVTNFTLYCITFNKPDWNAMSPDTAFIMKSRFSVITYFLLCVRERMSRKLRIFKEIKLDEVHFQKWKIYI